MIKNLLFVFVCFGIISCQNKYSDELDIGDLIAKGNIKDSTYNGLIKFYNKKTKALVKECTYINDRANGSYKEFYDNGILKLSGSFSDDKLNGYLNIYDSSGGLKFYNFFYYGLRMGPGSNYKRNLIKDYYFYSLENQELFHLNYDSIGTKGILDVTDKFIYINSSGMNDSVVEYRIYNINPPKYQCRYSLVTVDSSQGIKQTIYNFDSDSAWHTFKMNTNRLLPLNHFYAIKVEIVDSINHKDCVVQKFLE